MSADVMAVARKDSFRSASGRYACFRCGQPGDVTTPTSAIVVLYDNYPALRLAHAACVPSIAVRARGRIVGGAEVGDDPIVRVRATLLDRGPGRQVWPALLHEFVPLNLLLPAGSLHPYVAPLLRDGLVHLAGARALASLGPAPGWRLELLGSRARLAAPDGSVYYAGPWEAPANWEDLASECGGCLLLSGATGLYRRGALTAPADRLARHLDRAIRAGTVAGGVVPVARGVHGACAAGS
jgi:hypothetical protein